MKRPERKSRSRQAHRSDEVTLLPGITERDVIKMTRDAVRGATKDLAKQRAESQAYAAEERRQRQEVGLAVTRSVLQKLNDEMPRGGRSFSGRQLAYSRGAYGETVLVPIDPDQ